MKTLTALLIALTPGIYAWWNGKRLVGLLTDPLLAEHLWQHKKNLMRLFFGTLTAIIVMDNLRFWPLLILAALAGSFPSRKQLFGETWRFGGYLRFYLRLFLAFSGFNMLLMLTPAWVAAAGQWRWLAIALLGALLTGWLYFGLLFFSRLLGAKPMPESVTKSRFEAIAARSDVPMPLLLAVDFSGGKMANAFALPALPRSAVVFTQTLLDELRPDEADAIFAHELAHLEHWNTRRIKRRILISALLILIALLAAPFMQWAFNVEKLDSWKLLGVGVMLLFAYRWFIGDRRHQESAADCRAAALCGDAEALARGLVRLHELGRLPRRWDANTASSCTHPSLASRIQAIQAGISTSSREVTLPVILPSLQTGRFAILDTDRIHWLEGAPENIPHDPVQLRDQASMVITLAYRELRELLLKPTGKQSAVLYAGNRKGQKWQMPLGAKDIAIAQAALDQIDTRLGQGNDDEFGQQLRIGLLSLAILFLAAPQASALMLVLLALFCCLRPRLYSLAALGLLAVGWGLVDLLKNTSLTGSDLLRLAALSAIGAIAAGYAFKRSRGVPLQRGGDLWCLAGILALTAGSSWLAIAFAVAGDGSALLWYKALHAYPLAGISLFGMAGLIAIAGHKRHRYWLAGLTGLAAIASLFLQSAYFGKNCTDDPFASSAEILRWETITLQPARQFPLNGDFSDANLDLRLSPQAQLFAYRLPYSELSGADVYRTFAIANFGGQQTTLPADDIAFVDERRLLILDGPVLKLLEMRQNIWTQQKQWRLPPIKNARLEFAPSAGQWRIVGNDAAQRNALMISGILDKEQTTIQKFPSPQDRGEIPSLVTAGNNLLVAKTRYPRYASRSRQALAYRELWVTQGEEWHKIAATTRTSVDCLSSSVASGNAESIPCLLWGRKDTRIGWLHPETSQVQPLFQLTGEMGAYRSLLKDGRMYLDSEDGEVVSINPDLQRAIVLNVAEKGEYIADFAITGPWLLTLAMADEEQEYAKLQLFKLPESWLAQ